MIIINILFYNLTHAIIKVKSFINTGKLLKITIEDVIENYKKGRKPEDFAETNRNCFGRECA